MQQRRTLIALLGIALCSLLVVGCGESDQPRPDKVQVVNPLMEVASLEEMEKTLDFSVPVLEKDVDAYIVLVFDGYPQMGRIRYADGATFNVQYGSGDISGIYGGVEQGTEQVNGVSVTYLEYDGLRYALWETGGFTHCITGGEGLEAEVASLLN